ncbi:uncharacterized protein BDW43DRAFT_20910 [Aspergillus alliaceus]|uniref:uncharacterized protein n=1 Tax=Petromyces alliaceus TaxID=209559 RepID=UPI0012A65FB5|nr:uncharacterized protein BDW43DRAFT_20910 [Aspergillus alliaceus]KAB8227111.1 hypothetical protein BDW43DRAFT_20910 [Aspergillus alliaceus]
MEPSVLYHRARGRNRDRTLYNATNIPILPEMENMRLSPSMKSHTAQNHRTPTPRARNQPRISQDSTLV